MRSESSDLTIKDKGTLLRLYISKQSQGIAPFPAYFYRAKYIRQIEVLSQRCGEHTDVYMLCQLLECGDIYWLGKCLFEYRAHTENASSKVSIGDQLKFLSYLKSHANPIDYYDYRILFAFRLIRKNGWNKRSKKYSIILIQAIYKFGPINIINIVIFLTKRTLYYLFLKSKSKLKLKFQLI